MNRTMVTRDWEPRPDKPLMSVDLKLKDIEVDFGTADSIVSASMLDQYYNLKKEIEILADINPLLDFQKEDLKYNELLLNACIMVLKHYTVYENWPEELKTDHE